MVLISEELSKISHVTGLNMASKKLSVVHSYFHDLEPVWKMHVNNYITDLYIRDSHTVIDSAVAFIVASIKII